MVNLSDLFLGVFFVGSLIFLGIIMPLYFLKQDHKLSKSPYKGHWLKKIHFVGPLEPCIFQTDYHYVIAQSTIRKKQLGVFNPRDGSPKKRLYQLGGHLY